MTYLRALIAGMFLPSLLVPLMLTLTSLFGMAKMQNIMFFHVIPLLWGIWNVLYYALFVRILPGNETIKMLISGAVLGLIVAIIGVYWLGIPKMVGLPKHFSYAPLILAPIVYAILWWLVVKPVNHLVGLKK